MNNKTNGDDLPGANDNTAKVNDLGVYNPPAASASGDHLSVVQTLEYLNERHCLHGEYTESAFNQIADASIKDLVVDPKIIHAAVDWLVDYTNKDDLESVPACRLLPRHRELVEGDIHVAVIMTFAHLGSLDVELASGHPYWINRGWDVLESLDAGEDEEGPN